MFAFQNGMDYLLADFFSINLIGFIFLLAANFSVKTPIFNVFPKEVSLFKRVKGEAQR